MQMLTKNNNKKAAILDYKEEATNCSKNASNFFPLMTIMLILYTILSGLQRMHGEKTVIFRSSKVQIPGASHLNCELKFICVVYEGESLQN